MPRARLKAEEAVNMLLVKEIEKYPIIYNYKLEEYNKQHLVDAAWLEVSSHFDDSVKELKEKWRNLRTVFVRKLKTGKSRKRYYLNDAMRFLVPHIKWQQTADDHKISWAFDDTPAEEAEDVVEEHEVEPEEETSPPSSPPELKPETSGKRSGSRSSVCPQRRTIELIDPLSIYPKDEGTVSDDCIAFGKSIGLELGMIRDNEQKDIAKKLISDAVFLAKMGKLTYNAHVQTN